MDSCLFIHGGVVNVPADVGFTVHTLPRSLNDSETIPIKLKRRLSYKHHYQFQHIRPRRVLEAIRYLVQTSELFKKGIKVQESWINGICSENTDEWHEFLRDRKANTDCSSDESQETFSETQEINGDSLERANSTDSVDDNDDWCEVEEHFSGSLDTLLQPQEMINGVDRIISFAPGEGNRPLGILMDTESEYLSFSTIFFVENKELLPKREKCLSPTALVLYVNGNCEAKTGDLQSLCQIYFTN